MNRLLILSLTICFFTGAPSLFGAAAPTVLHPADVPVFCGITATELPDDMRLELGNTLPGNAGLGVTAVSRFGPAEDAGIRPADIILDVDGTPIASKPALLALLQKHRPGETLPVTVLRMGHRYELSLTLAPRETAAARTAPPAPKRTLTNATFDEIMRLQALAAWQLSRAQPDVPRVLEALGRIRTLASGGSTTGLAYIYLADQQGSIEIRGNEHSAIVNVGSSDADTYILDANTLTNPLPTHLRQRLANIAQ